MIKDPLLTKAAILAKKRDFEGAIKILKSEEEHYYGSFNYFYLYAVICLHSGGFLEALTNFRHARQLKMKDKYTMLGLAVLHLKRMDTVQALDYYLDVKEIDPRNRIAKKGLAVIRKHSNPDSLSAWITPKRLSKLYPPIPAPAITGKTLLKAFVLLITAGILSVIILSFLNIIPNPLPARNRSPRSSLELTLTSSDRNAPLETGGVYLYILTRDQAVSLYERALSLFTSHRDEEAKVNINRLLESNASSAIKDKAALLLSYMDVPGFDTFRRNSNFSLSDVRSEPALYRGVYVIWRGMATNIEITEDGETRFDFLVGYDTRRVLEGIVPVIFERPIAINTERPLEVLGRIGISGLNMDIFLEGEAIHQSGRPEQD